MIAPLNLDYPFAGRWLVQNSPADRVPSHGTAVFASSYAIDFVPVTDTGRTAPFGIGSLFGTEPPTRFPGFGREILAPIAGTVVAVQEDETDHPAYRGLSSIGYALIQHRRSASGWTGLAGNHIFIEYQGVIITLCHLQRGSVEVRAGQQVGSGAVIARCGNSGNSTEPHLHVQAIDGADLRRAQAVPLTFRGALPRNREVVDASESALPPDDRQRDR